MNRKKIGATAIAMTLALGLAFNTVAPKRAEAIVGLASGPVGIAVLGGAMMAVGGTWVGGMAIVQSLSGALGSGAGHPGAYAFGGLQIVLGLVLLDGQPASSLQFVPVTDAQAEALRMTEVQKLAFNGSVDEINAVAEIVAHDLIEGQVLTAEAAKALWEKYGSALDSDALEGVAKVAAGVK
jgi:hypothetical protein